MSQSPHLRKIEEFSRSSNGLGQDAVLVVESGRNLGLYVVPAGKATHGASSKATFIHAGPLTCRWDEHVIRIEGEFEDVLVTKSKRLISRSSHSVEIDSKI